MTLNRIWRTNKHINDFQISHRYKVSSRIIASCIYHIFETTKKVRKTREDLTLKGHRSQNSLNVFKTCLVQGLEESCAVDMVCWKGTQLSRIPFKKQHNSSLPLLWRRPHVSQLWINISLWLKPDYTQDGLAPGGVKSRLEERSD